MNGVAKKIYMQRNVRVIIIMGIFNILKVFNARMYVSSYVHKMYKQGKVNILCPTNKGLPDTL